MPISRPMVTITAFSGGLPVTCRMTTRSTAAPMASPLISATMKASQ